jgi:hypothetical protein
MNDLSCVHAVFYEYLVIALTSEKTRREKFFVTM